MSPCDFNRPITAPAVNDSDFVNAVQCSNGIESLPDSCRFVEGRDDD